MSACKICGEQLWPVKGYENDQFTLLKCQNCSLCTISPLPSDEVLEHFYANYHKRYKYKFENRALRSINRKTWETRAQHVQHLAPKASSLLDIGCGQGNFLQVAQCIPTTHGIDISAKNIQICQNKMLSVSKQDINNFSTTRQYSVVCAWDVLEHIKHPDIVMRKIHNLTEDGGLLCFSTINIKSVSALYRKRKWRYFCPPEHLQYYCPKSIRHLLAKYSFKIIRMRTSFKLQAWGEETVVQNKYVSGNKTIMQLKNLVESILDTTIGNIIHTGEIIEVYAEKIQK